MSTVQRIEETLSDVNLPNLPKEVVVHHSLLLSTNQELNEVQQDALTLLCEYCAHHQMDAVNLHVFSQTFSDYAKTMVRIKETEVRINQAYLADPDMKYHVGSSLNAYLYILNTTQLGPVQRYTLAMQYLDHINACLDADPQESVSTSMMAVMLLTTAKNYGWTDDGEGKPLSPWQRIKQLFSSK